MSKILKKLILRIWTLSFFLYSLNILAISGVLMGSLSILKPGIPEVEAQLVKEPVVLSTEGLENELITLQDNTLIPISNPSNPESQVIQEIKVVITGYSSSPWETDDDPYITAAGTWVREGIVANNFLDFGTKIRIPELYGDKIFVVEDRMNWEKGKYHIDIWFSDYWQALNFGAKRTYIEVLES